MSSIRALRRSRGLTLIDLALLADIPARTLAEIEHGLQRLDFESRARLARALQVPPESLRGGPARSGSPAAWLRQLSPALLLALTGAVLLAGLFVIRTPARTSAAPPRALAAPTQPAPTQPRPTDQPAAAATAAPPSSPTAIAAPATPAPPFTLAADGPHGCPLAPPAGRVVLTQGYAEGTHAPASVWGAVDLGVDGDGDGFAEPGTTQGAQILATIGGVALVYPGSWPGGNFVRVVNEAAGWSVAYAHLDAIAVADGQAIEAGATVGTVGSTGMATGPHLHYEVWRGGENVDPTGLIECR